MSGQRVIDAAVAWIKADDDDIESTCEELGNAVDFYLASQRIANQRFASECVRCGRSRMIVVWVHEPSKEPTGPYCTSCARTTP